MHVLLFRKAKQLYGVRISSLLAAGTKNVLKCDANAQKIPIFPQTQDSPKTYCVLCYGRRCVAHLPVNSGGNFFHFRCNSRHCRSAARRAIAVRLSQACRQLRDRSYRVDWALKRKIENSTHISTDFKGKCIKRTWWIFEWPSGIVGTTMSLRN